MEINVPFFYTCAVRGHRKVNFKEQTFGDTVVANVPDVTSDEAPVAVIIRPPEYAPEKGVGPDGLIEARYYDGRFWEPAVSRSLEWTENHERVNVIRHLPIEVFDELEGNPFISHNEKTYLQRWLDGVDNQGSPEDYPAHHAHTNTRIAEIQRLHDEADNMLLVDGMLWRTRNEPVLYVDQNFSWGGDTITIGWGAAPDKLRSDPSESYQRFYFRADRFDDAVSFAEALNASFHKGEAQVYHHDGSAVLMPETLRWEDDLNDLYVVANFIKSSFSGRDLETATEEQATSWIRLRNNLVAYKADMTEENALLTMTSIDEFMVHSKSDGYASSLYLAFGHRWEMHLEDTHILIAGI